MSIPTKVGRYRISGELGRGAMGAVYRGHDPQLDRPVAIKMISVPLGGSVLAGDEAEQRFLREARVAARITHPNIVAVYDAGREGDDLFLVMELVEGESLAARTSRGEFPATAEALELVAQAAEALGVAHAAGVIHRDIKPANILLTREGQAKVSDFGIAKAVGDATELTRTGMLVGSPAYMAPEQIKGQTLDGRSDLFSLGVVLYELLLRRKPFPADTVTTLVYQILHEDPLADPALTSGLPAELSSLLRWCLAKEVAARVPDGRTLAAHCRSLAMRSGGLADTAPTTVLSGERLAAILSPAVAQPSQATGPAAAAGAAAAGAATVPLGAPLAASAPSGSVAAAAAVEGVGTDGVPTRILQAVRPPSPPPPPSPPSPERVPPPVPQRTVAVAPAPSTSSAAPSKRGWLWALGALAIVAGFALAGLLLRSPAPPPLPGGGSLPATAPPPGDEPATPVGTPFGPTDVEPTPTATPTSTPEPRPTPLPGTEPRPTARSADPPAIVETPAIPTPAPTPTPELPPISQTYSCKKAAEFHIDPEDARVAIDGVDIGVSDDWDDMGGGKQWKFAGPGRHLARLSMKGFETVWVELVVGPDGEDSVCDVSLDLKESD